jgi:dTDP-glucose 4,6-dehydratase
MKTHLVTGGAGFIGSNYIIYMLNQYQNIKIVNLDALTYAGNLENLKSIESNPNHIFVNGNICDKSLVEKLFDEHQFDVVVNFAAESHVDRSIEDPDVFSKTNVMGTLNLLNVSKAAWSIGDESYRDGVKFIQVSTDEVYGSLGADGYFTETTPLDPHSPYSASKASADLFVKAYADTYKLPINITRCSNNYGPFQFPEKLIPLMINNCLNHQTLPVYGDGLQVRDWLYVEDHCKAIDMVIQKGSLGEIYNIGGHNERYNIDIVKSIIAYLKENADDTISEALIKHVTDRKGHDRRYGIDPKKICDELGWKPETMFDEGIKKTIRWYLDNKNWMQRVTSGAYQTYIDNMYGGR